jgi:hypothetical protein
LVPQPKAAEIYYSTCGKIDQHNRDRQATLGLEHRIKTHDWASCVNMSIFSMSIVDSWKVWSQMSMNALSEVPEVQKRYYANLAADLIDNEYDTVGGGRKRNDPNDITTDTLHSSIYNHNTNECRRGVGNHLTPTKRCRITDHKLTTHEFPGHCMVCKINKSILECSECVDNPNGRRDFYICDTKKRDCFEIHILSHHT